MPSLSPSDLSSDNSDLAMLKSLLAGLSLPSKSGILDRGSDEEKDGESELGGRVTPGGEPAVCFGARMLLWAVCCACSSSNSPMKGYLGWRMVLIYSAISNQYLGWVNLFSCQWYHNRSRRTALNKGEFHCCGFCLPQPHFRIDLSRDPKGTSTSPLFSLQLAWENHSVLKQFGKGPSLCVS